MINSLFFDSDCISAFLWVGNENLLVKLYADNIIIPKDVYDELSYPGIAHLKKRVDMLIINRQAQVMTIDSGTEAYQLFYQLTEKPKAGHKIIGRGEASSIVLAKQSNGIVASNNLKDIALYIKELGLKHLTTGDILLQALSKGYITEMQGNTIWSNMLAKRRKLGDVSFTAYIESTNYHTTTNI